VPDPGAQQRVGVFGVEGLDDAPQRGLRRRDPPPGVRVDAGADPFQNVLGQVRGLITDLAEATVWGATSG